MRISPVFLSIWFAVYSCLASPVSASAEEEDEVSVEVAADDVENPPWLGAAGPEAGTVVLTTGGGLFFFLPYATAGLRVGMGAGTSLEFRYEMLMVLGQSGSVRLGWGLPVSEHIDLGLGLISTISTLEAANGLVGIEFAAFELGNDWELGGELVLTWHRPGEATITMSLGANWTLGGLRYSGYEVRDLELDPGFRSLQAGVTGEWTLSSDLNLFIGFDLLLPLAADLIPLGYIPTGSAGVAWGL